MKYSHHQIKYIGK